MALATRSKRSGSAVPSTLSCPGPMSRLARRSPDRAVVAQFAADEAVDGRAHQSTQASAGPRVATSRAARLAKASPDGGLAPPRRCATGRCRCARRGCPPAGRPASGSGGRRCAPAASRASRHPITLRGHGIGHGKLEPARPSPASSSSPPRRRPGLQTSRRGGPASRSARDRGADGRQGKVDLPVRVAAEPQPASARSTRRGRKLPRASAAVDSSTATEGKARAQPRRGLRQPHADQAQIQPRGAVRRA